MSRRVWLWRHDWNEPDNALVVEGCVLIVCSKQVWRKATSVAAALR